MKKTLFKKNIVSILLVSIATVIALPSYAAIGLDRTRVIFNGNKDTMSVNIKNNNKLLPYLAQAWIEGADGKKITAGPLIMTPPVQRVEPETKSRILISKTGLASKLPKDRESVFYFNLREIPPQSDKENVLQLALQTKVKLFYRPEAIVQDPNAIWQDELIFTETKDGYQVENPTPYHVTVIDVQGKNTTDEADFNPIMIAPKSTMEIQSDHYSTLSMTYINDFGGRPTIDFVCKNKVCKFEDK